MLSFMDEHADEGWFTNLEEIHVVNNYIAMFDIMQEAMNPGYAANLTDSIMFYLNWICTDKINFPKLRYIDLRMNGYNLQGGDFADQLINACSNSTDVTIVANETLVKYPVFCLNNTDFQSSSITQTYYYDMTDPKDAAQCRFNWNWEVTGSFNNDITGPYPLSDTPNCPGYE